MISVEQIDLYVRSVLWAIPVILAISLHEVAHGAVANYFGDNTARVAGRLTLNPLKHIDPVGSLVIPLVLLWFSGFVFGWARPVPVDQGKLARPRRDMLFVTAAGPFANLLMSFLWAMGMKLGVWLSASFPAAGLMLIYMSAAGVFINTAIMMLNLLPILPLDGGRILADLLPGRSGQWLKQLEPWGLPILCVLILSGLAARLVWPMMVAGMAVVTYAIDVPVELLVNSLWLMTGKAAFQGR